MSINNWLNIVGLIFDIAGVVLLFFYERPKEGDSLLLESAPSLEEREKEKKLKNNFSKLALLLLIVGFTIQIISNLL